MELLILMRNASCRVIVLCVAVQLAPSIAAQTPEKLSSIDAAATAQFARQNAERRFVKARFLKPRRLDPSQPEHEFAPLVVEEVKEFAKESSISKGVTDLASQKTILGPKAVYFQAGQVRAGDHLLDQIIFLWGYEDSGLGNDEAKGRVRGVRVILGLDGMPVLWESLEGSGKTRVFFAARSLEAAAGKEFGSVLPARKFAVERAEDEASNVVLARLVDDGPVPMGPYVYVEDSSERKVTTVHCRCSSSQFEEVVETVEYDLLPLEDVDASLRKRAGIDLGKFIECPPLDTLFRWPKLKP